MPDKKHQRIKISLMTEKVVAVILLVCFSGKYLRKSVREFAIIRPSKLTLTL